MESIDDRLRILEIDKIYIHYNPNSIFIISNNWNTGIVGDTLLKAIEKAESIFINKEKSK